MSAPTNFMHEPIRTIVVGDDPALGVTTAVGAQLESFRQSDRPYHGRRVSLAGDGDRPRAAFATAGAPLPAPLTAPKRIATGAAVLSGPPLAAIASPTALCSKGGGGEVDWANA